MKPIPKAVQQDKCMQNARITSIEPWPRQFATRAQGKPDFND
jgi:hypothetical protein